jgi:hypothetical protein
MPVDSASVGAVMSGKLLDRNGRPIRTLQLQEHDRGEALGDAAHLKTAAE